MKFVHLSDLHLGKRVNEYSMIEDQKDILSKIISIVKDEQPNGILLAGDIYDKSVPPTEAVTLLDDFLVSLAALRCPVYAISGNHDSPERMAFGGRLMMQSGVHFAPIYQGVVQPITLQDEFGKLQLFMLPYIKNTQVRRICELHSDDCSAEIFTDTDAIRYAISQMNVDFANRNVLLAHQFIAGSTRCDSEDCMVGGTEAISPSVFDQFDYVALGHLHKAQFVSRETIRYCGTPLKYSFSEINDTKSLSIVEFFEKGRVCIRTIPLSPLHDLREIRGNYMELTAKSFYSQTNTNDYLHIILTDESDVVDAIGKLRVIYPNIMKLEYDNARTRHQEVFSCIDRQNQKSPFELIEELFEKQNNRSFSETQKQYVQKLIASIWGDDK